MSAEMAVRDAAIAGLRADAALMGEANAVFDGAPARGSAPYVVVGECLGTDWGGKALDGREVRLAISLVDAGEGPGRLSVMLARVDAVMRSMGAVAEGWRVVTAGLVRSRVVRGESTGWQAVADWRLRVVRD